MVNEKFELLYTVLAMLERQGVLAHCVLVGSWCQDFYRHLFANPYQIPAATTTDADLLVPKRIKVKNVNIAAAMEQNGFKVELEQPSGLMHFIHEDFKFEFLTLAGAKPDESVYRFKGLNLTAQELHFMNIPLCYKFTTSFRDISITLPEPEAFALHKLIVSQRRTDPLKKQKDIDTAKGMLQFIEADEKRRERLHQILDDFRESWRKKVNAALKVTGITLPQRPPHG